MTTADDGSTIPDFSRAMSASVGPANSVWSMPMLVITATCAWTTFVASQRPSRPTSTTATSTATSANQRNAAAVHASKYDGRTPVSPSRSATAAICSANSSSLIGSALRARRSFTRSRCGLVYVPTVSPWTISSRVIICAVDPLPLVPVMWITGWLSWGSPIAATRRVIGSNVGEVIRPVFSYDACSSRYASASP